MTTPPPEVPPASLPAAGWYPDPENDRVLRRWSGTAWTDETTTRSVVTRKVGFGEAISRAFKGAFTYSGRSTAAEFWWFFLFNILVTMALYVLIIITTPSDPISRMAGDAGIAPIFGLLLFAWFIVSLVLMIPLIVRRLHDKDMTGWFVIMAVIPIASLVLLILLMGEGTRGPNRYGPVPSR